METILISTALFGVVLFLVYFKVCHVYSYWRKKGVKGPQPILLFGNFALYALRQKSIGMITKDAYNEFKGEKLVGLYKGMSPIIILRDLELIKRILVKDFDYFDDRMDSSKSDLKHNLFAVDGETWRVLREKLSPVFTSRKLKNMFYLIQEAADKFEIYITTLIEKNTQIEVCELMEKYNMESIGSCAFGLNVDALNDKKNIYRDIGHRLASPNLFKLIIEHLYPSLADHLKIEAMDGTIFEFFQQMVQYLIKERQGKEKIRHDIMDLLIEMKESGNVTGTKLKNKNGHTLEVDDKLIAAQAFVFFAGGFETSSSTMSFMLYELAKHKDIQVRARKEVDIIFEKYGSLNYEALIELEYLDMVMSETLRMYPVLENIIRRCNANYHIPEINITIEKGTIIFIPIIGIQNDPDIVACPEIFEPDNYSKENKSKVPLLAFGEGPRNCIGKRFGKIQVLLGMATLLRNFIISTSDKTQTSIDFAPMSFVLASKDGIWLTLEKRTEYSY